MNILIVSHDAGGAQVLSSYVKQFPNHNYQFILSGPAQHIFKEKIKNLTQSPQHKLKDLLCAQDQVLTSTSWSSNLEKHALQLAKRYGIFSISILDHWVNYASRFKLSGLTVLPNQIWVVRSIC